MSSSVDPASSPPAAAAKVENQHSVHKVVLSGINVEVLVPRSSEADEPRTWTVNDERKRDRSGGGLFEKVRNVWGSSAGAGSDFFDTYRRDRAEELRRVKAMEIRAREKEEHEAFQAKRQAAAELNALRSKRALKRRERKMKKKTAATAASVVVATGDEASSPEKELPAEESTAETGALSKEAAAPAPVERKVSENIKLLEEEETEF